MTDDDTEPRTSRGHAMFVLQEGDPRPTAQRAQAFALLAVADELTAVRVATGGALQAAAPGIAGAWMDLMSVARDGVTALVRIADALESQVDAVPRRVTPPL